MFGLSPPWLLHDGVVVPSALALSHNEQLGRLARYCAPAVEIAAVVGDLCLDRMAASRHLRQAYRAAFGAHGARRLIVVSSTWGPRSLFGRSPHLLRQLVAELPMDRYAVVAALHPNIWHGHSPWQIRGWLTDCVRAGLVLLPAWDGWRAALVAADVVVGDHGSVTFYAGALGRPVLLGASDPEGVDPDSPVARFTAAAPQLIAHASLVDQIEGVLSAPGSVDREIVEQATSAPGRAAALTRHLLYDILRLAEPRHPATTSIIPVPGTAEVERRPVTALLVRASNGTEAGRNRLRLERYPAELRWEDPPPGDTHLLVRWRHHDVRLLATADVLLCDATEAGNSPRGWIRDTLQTYPGSTVAVLALGDGGCLAGVRDGRLFNVRTVVDPTAQVDADEELSASALYARLTGSSAPQEVPGSFDLDVAGVRHRILITEAADR